MEYPEGARRGLDHLSSTLAASGFAAREAIDQAGEFGEPDTADLFIEVSMGIEPWPWLVEARLQEPPR
ncbi:ferritin family protein [Tautonia plasticadhaerens]|uniref:hypothetical protein n=1 Tax=Tautonia plasticadhaerens TaxID=2527974 RepID=UPI001E2D80F9|nr:hypothetical protein [Tautonia plasticadhaerens]